MHESHVRREPGQSEDPQVCRDRHSGNLFDDTERRCVTLCDIAPPEVMDHDGADRVRDGGGFDDPTDGPAGHRLAQHERRDV